MSKAKIAALVGSTASGKSDVAYEIAKSTGAHILSCDSLLIYKGLNIGTAKPSTEELSTVPHYGIDLVEADGVFNAGDYVRYARKVIDDCVAKNVPLLIVGGTGFYLKALLLGIWDAPPTNEDFRRDLMKSVAHHTIEEQKQILYRMLSEKDAAYASKINMNDIYRVIRAIEIMHFARSSVTELLQKQSKEKALPYACPVFGIRRNQRDLERRIHERTNKMFERGFVNEVKALVEKYGQNLPRGLESVGYFEVLSFLKGEFTSLAACRERIEISTRQLAKKQRTFFRGMTIPIEWFELPADEETLTHALRSSLK